MAQACIETMLTANEGNIVAWQNHTGAHIIPVDANPYNFLNHQLTVAQKNDLFTRGYNAAIKFIYGGQQKAA